MPDYSNILGMIGYGGSDLQSLFKDFQGPKDVWAGLLEPQFELAQSALGELPGQRRGMLEQLSSGLQGRNIAAGRGILGRSAGAGFAGSGQISQLGALSRRGFEQEAGRGRYGIGQDIMKREAGILGGLSSNVGSFLQSLLAAGTETVGDDTGIDWGDADPDFKSWMADNYPDLDYEGFSSVEIQGYATQYQSYLDSLGDTDDTPATGPGSLDISDAPGNYYNPFGVNYVKSTE